MALTTLLEISDFKHPFKVFEKNNNNDGSEKYFDEILEFAQKEYLITLLGYRMYNYMKDNYVSGSGDFYDLLVSGTDYTVNDIEYNYEGIKPSLMRYSYYHWQRWKATDLNKNGAIVQSFENSVKVIPAKRMFKAYNEMCDDINGSEAYRPTVYHYIYNNYTGDLWDYKGFKKISYLL